MRERIQIVVPQLSDQRNPVLDFAEGLVRHGNSVVYSDDIPFPPSKLVVIFQWGRNYQYRLGKNLNRINGRPLVINYGYVGRPHYWAASWDNQNGRGECYETGVERDRWDALGIAIKPYRTKGTHIILVGQVPKDSAIERLDLYQWAMNTVAELRTKTNRPIIFRPHPLAREITPHIPGTIRSERTLDEDLKDAWAVVTYNSTTASVAVLDGVPVFAFDAGSIAWPICNRTLDRIERPHLNPREQWAIELGYMQWTREEFRNGTAWEHLKQGDPR